MIPGGVSGALAAQQISDSMCVGDVSEASLDDLLLSENEAMETGGNNSDPPSADPNLDNQK